MSQSIGRRCVQPLKGIRGPLSAAKTTVATMSSADSDRTTATGLLSAVDPPGRDARGIVCSGT